MRTAERHDDMGKPAWAARLNHTANIPRISVERFAVVILGVR